MKNRSLLARKRKIFYVDVNEKRKGKKMRLQADKEFLQNEIKKLIMKYNVELFSTNTRGGKIFAAE